MKLLVTGGSGFIGSNFVRHVLATHADDTVVNLDKLTYAGNPANLKDVERDPRYAFVHGDICDAALVRDVLRGVDAVVNFAAESHVDRSLVEPDGFLRTDVFGVFTLLEAVRECRVPRFLHVSTDEVYGSVAHGSSTEQDPVRPSNPYSASKAAGDLLALSYWRTHGVPVVITRSSNNFGPFQYPEKVVPLFITNAIDDQPLRRGRIDARLHTQAHHRRLGASHVRRQRRHRVRRQPRRGRAGHGERRQREHHPGSDEQHHRDHGAA